MWWVESTQNSSPNFQSTSHTVEASAGLSNLPSVDSSAASSKIAQKLHTHIERLEELVALANSRFVEVKEQGTAETEAHSTIVRNLQRRHDNETAALSKKIAELQHSQAGAARVQKQMLVEFASRQSEQASKIEAAEHAARLSSEKMDRLRREYRECLAELDIQCKLVAQQKNLLNDLQFEKSQLLDQVTAANGDCQQFEIELQQKNAALQDSNDRLDAIMSAQSALKARLKQQQVELGRKIAEIEKKSRLVKQKEQRQQQLDTQAFQQTITGLEQSLAQSIAARSSLQDSLKQLQVEHSRQIAEIERKSRSATQKEQRQHELEKRELQQTISGLEQSLAQSVAAQSVLQDSLQQQQVEHTRQIAEIEQKSHLATQDEQRQHELETHALQQTISGLEQLLAQSVAAQSVLQDSLQQQQLEHKQQIAEIKQQAHLAVQEEQRQHELETLALQQTISGLEQSLGQSVLVQSEVQARLQQTQVEHRRQIAEIEQKSLLVVQEKQRQHELETQALQQTISQLERSLGQSVSVQSEVQVRLQQQQVEYSRQIAEIELMAQLAVQEKQSQHELEKHALQQNISGLEQVLAQSVAAQSALHDSLQQQQVEHTQRMAEIEQKTFAAAAQVDLEITQLREKSLAYREKSASEIASLKTLVQELELKQSEKQATLDCQTTKFREQEELLKSAIAERERLAARCHELTVDGQQAIEHWQARLHSESAKHEALAQQLGSLEQYLASEIARYELELRQLTDRHQGDCDVLRSTIRELNQAHDTSQRDLREQQRLFELCEEEYNRRLQEVEQNSRSVLEQSQQQCLKLRNELDQALAINTCREKQHEDYCVKLMADIDGLTRIVAELQSQQTEAQAKYSAQKSLVEQRSAVADSLRTENERLSVRYRELATDHNQLCDRWKRSVEQESEAREAASALQEVERALKGQVQEQAEQIINLHEQTEKLRVTHRHQSQAHHQCVTELRAEITRSQSLLEMQKQQLDEFRCEVDILRNALAEAKNAQELARRDSDDNARSAQKFGAQCLLLQEQLQKASAARRKAESALIRAAEIADTNSIADITRREIETQQSVERLVLELKSTRLVCLSLKRQSNNFQQEIERLKSELQSMTTASKC